MVGMSMIAGRSPETSKRTMAPSNSLRIAISAVPRNTMNRSTELLMPTEIVQQRREYLAVEGLADFFGVSREAMSFRLKNLR
jgi:hypothetical protein